MKTMDNNHDELEVSSIKRRDLAPLNVYVRIRPFIGDEIQRGENQHLISIIDEKHIAIKLPATITNTIRLQQTSYNEYAVTKIFDHCCSQHDLFEEILQQPTDDLFRGNNWLFSTLGLTNSGKTHTMFGTSDKSGLIPKCLERIFINVGEKIDENLLFKPDGLENLISTDDSNFDTEIHVRNYIFSDEKRRTRLPKIVQHHQSLDELSADENHYSIWISFFELYNENILDLLVQPKQMKIRKNLRLMQNDHSTIIKNLIQIPVFDQHEAEEIIKFGFANRSTSKTNLNEASSRSHAILCITLITINEFNDEPTLSHMYICDLAGNEPSIGTGKQLTETCNINTSLMTFKDCIRVLNENHTSKKQMLVPYRNSVLTSIFRPFFIGRGRTIICCNVNPCATFIGQTNDLLKFSALAQKTVVVPIESKSVAVFRTQRKSKLKRPKRLQRESFLKKKIPIDSNSIAFWKYSLKKSFDLLEKQAANRRAFLIERHVERVKTVEYFLRQRDQLERLTRENLSISKQNEILKENLRHERDEHLHTQQLYADAIRNEKDSRKKFVQIEKEKCSFEGKLQLKTDEIQRLKREIGLELYRKQEAEKKCRSVEEKFRHEQTENHKLQLDLTKTKHELNTFKVKFDVLQFEFDEMKKKPSIQPDESIKMFDDRTSTRSKRRTDDENPVEKQRKKTKRTTAETNPYGEIEIEIQPDVTMPIKRTRTKRESNSPIYATIQRKIEPNETPKTSTFKRIQTFFRATPTSTNSTRTTRVTQMKTTTVAFGSSTPTNRVPPTSTPPKSKYNLRTRIFQNPTSTEKLNDESKTSKVKKPVRTRK